MLARVEGFLIALVLTYRVAGLIYVHAFPEFDPYGDEVDEIGVKQGVTTIVDAGSCGADRIADLVKVENRQRQIYLPFKYFSHRFETN